MDRERVYITTRFGEAVIHRYGVHETKDIYRSFVHDSEAKAWCHIFGYSHDYCSECYPVSE